MIQHQELPVSYTNEFVVCLRARCKKIEYVSLHQVYSEQTVHPVCHPPHYSAIVSVTLHIIQLSEESSPFNRSGNLTVAVCILLNVVNS